MIGQREIPCKWVKMVRIVIPAGLLSRNPGAFPRFTKGFSAPVRLRHISQWNRATHIVRAPSLPQPEWGARRITDLASRFRLYSRSSLLASRFHFYSKPAPPLASIILQKKFLLPNGNRSGNTSGNRNGNRSGKKQMMIIRSQLELQGRGQKRRTRFRKPGQRTFYSLGAKKYTAFSGSKRRNSSGMCW